ncbi:MAG: hypothetical protein IT229_12520 [Flavobacteriales bacterium]|nr:hypothetical protein [Flavobacteriales bacterium]
MNPDRSIPRSFLTALLLLILCAVGKAQELVDNIYVYGTAKDYGTAVKLQGVSVIVHQDDVRLAALVTDSLGRYEVNLDYDHVYKLWFMHAGMVTKHVVIDAREIPSGLRAGGFGMNIDITLFKSLPNLDMSVLDQPIGRANYSPVDSAITWDLEYTESIRSRVAQAMMRMDSLNKVNGTSP